ncbi:MAG: hypothetical protein IKF90_21880 [Parasporobacterium sp.]|nr:hypothetical protein [Parasporobacterium sp.]
MFFLLWFDKRKKDCKSHPWKDHLQSPLKGTFMVIAGRISDKTKNTNKSESRSKKHKRRNPCSAPDDWNPNDPVQLKYDEMISKLTLPIGYVFWGCYFRRLIIPGCQEILLRVQRLARKKDDGGYETHAIMCQEGIPYLANTVDFFLELMREPEECALEENEELEDREKSYFQWLKAKMAEELSWLNKLNLSLKNTAEEISAAFIENLSRQFFQNSRIKIRFVKDLTT